MTRGSLVFWNVVVVAHLVQVVWGVEPPIASLRISKLPGYLLSSHNTANIPPKLIRGPSSSPEDSPLTLPEPSFNQSDSISDADLEKELVSSGVPIETVRAGIQCRNLETILVQCMTEMGLTTISDETRTPIVEGCACRQDAASAWQGCIQFATDMGYQTVGLNEEDVTLWTTNYVTECQNLGQPVELTMELTPNPGSLRSKDRSDGTRITPLVMMYTAAICVLIIFWVLFLF